MQYLFAIFFVLLSYQQPTPEPEVTATPESPVFDLVIAEFHIDRLSPLIGETLELTLRAELPPEVSIEQWPEISGEWGVFTVQSSTPLEISEENDNLQIYQQQFEIIAWRTGDIQTPDTFISYRVDGFDEIYNIPITPAYLTVPSVLETQNLNQLELRPAASPIGFFFVPWWVITLGLLSASGVIWVGRNQIRQWYKEVKERPSHRPQKSLAQLTLEKLDAVPQNKPDTAFAQIAHILRNYIATSHSTLTTDQPTNQFITNLQNTGLLDDKQVNQLNQILSQADLVKFTPLAPRSDAVDRIVQQAKQWVKGTEQNLKAYEDNQ